MDKDLQLRKDAVHLATMITHGLQGTFMETAAAVYAFLKAGPAAPDKACAAPEQDDPRRLPSYPQPPQNLPVRQQGLPPLTVMQKSVLKHAVELYMETSRVTGTDVGNAMNWTTPSATNQYLKKLERMGYVRRDGWFITPLFRHDGTPVGPVVQKLPDGAAKGYRPLTVPMGSVGRIQT